jgi:hypothetical protein
MTLKEAKKILQQWERKNSRKLVIANPHEQMQLRIAAAVVQAAE